MKLLSQINDPSDIRRLPQSKLQPLADEVREYGLERFVNASAAVWRE